MQQIFFIIKNDSLYFWLWKHYFKTNPKKQNKNPKNKKPPKQNNNNKIQYLQKNPPQILFELDAKFCTTVVYTCYVNGMLMGGNNVTGTQSPCLWAEKSLVPSAGRGTAGGELGRAHDPAHTIYRIQILTIVVSTLMWNSLPLSRSLWWPLVTLTDRFKGVLLSLGKDSRILTFHGFLIFWLEERKHPSSPVAPTLFHPPSRNLPQTLIRHADNVDNVNGVDSAAGSCL